MKRSFLFLQGPCTPFFERLAQALKAQGHKIHKINFCAGDIIYGGRQSTSWFNKTPGHLVDFLSDIYQRYGITDQVLFGDQRPVHQPAVQLAKQRGIRNHVFEEGYFRPRWITLEREGVNNHSLLPHDPQWYWEVGGRLPDDPFTVAFKSSFVDRAVHDVAYHVAGLLNPLLFPRYKNHAGISAPVEYAGYVKRLTHLRFIREREKIRARKISLGKAPFYVLPLQLNTDAQIRHHSQFSDMRELIEYVLASFAKHAPTDSHIVIKNHPLDIGWMNYQKIIADCKKRFDLAGRVHYLEEGGWAMLGSNARGVVTVNSTAGTVALEYGVPLKALSDPIYNLPGLTCQLPLDDFWREGTQPNVELFKRFRRCVLHATQVNGGFYSDEAIALAVQNSIPVLTAEQSPLERLL